MQTFCPPIGLYKLFKTRQGLTTLKSLINTKWCPRTKLRWIFPYVQWYWCYLFVILSKLMSSTWNRCSRLAIRRVIKCFTFHLSTRKGKRNSNNNTSFLGVDIGCLRMKDLRLSCLLILTSILFLSACILFGMVIIAYRLASLY